MVCGVCVLDWCYLLCLLFEQVSVLLRERAQQQSGRFILPPVSPASPLSEVPGSIRCVCVFVCASLIKWSNLGLHGVVWWWCVWCGGNIFDRGTGCT